jgi:hypothetical protein
MKGGAAIAETLSPGTQTEYLHPTHPLLYLEDGRMKP